MGMILYHVTSWCAKEALFAKCTSHCLCSQVAPRQLFDQLDRCHGGDIPFGLPQVIGDEAVGNGDKAASVVEDGAVEPPPLGDARCCFGRFPLG